MTGPRAGRPSRVCPLPLGHTALLRFVSSLSLPLVSKEKVVIIDSSMDGWMDGFWMDPVVSFVRIRSR
jgi:hypothetical protein